MSLIVVNIVNVVLLIVLLIVYAALGFPLWYISMLIVYVIYMLLVNFFVLRQMDIRTQLLRADRKRMFRDEVLGLVRASDSVEFYRNIFWKYEMDDPIRRTYDVLSNKSDLNMRRAIKWLHHYNPVSCPSSEYIRRLSDNSQHIVRKLDELNEVVIKLEDNVSDVDLSYVDNMLNSLKEIIEDE